MRKIYRISFDGGSVDVEADDIPKACEKCLAWIKSDNPKAGTTAADILTVSLHSVPLDEAQ